MIRFIGNLMKSVSVERSSSAAPNIIMQEQKIQNPTTNQSPSPKRTYPASKIVGLLLGPALFILIMLFFSPPGLSYEGKSVIAVTLWVATWWISESIPIPVTSLLPILLLPMTGTITSNQVTSSYGNDIIFLFLGGFFLAAALEKWNLHKRLALLILTVMGTKTNNLLFGFMFATAFLSMWISATATAMMMMPMGLALVAQLKNVNSVDHEKSDIRKFEKSLLFSICYAATVGGMATIVGNPPNMVLVAQMQQFFNIDINFGVWMIFAMPIVILIMFFSWLYLSRFAFPLQIKSIPGGKDLITKEKQQLGKSGREEKIVIAIFLFTAFMWITRGFIWNTYFPFLTDGMIAILATVLLFLIPASKEKGRRILEWDDSKNISWGVLLLFGGGLAIASGFQESGLSEWIGSSFLMMDDMSLWVMITISIIFVLLLTEITSNTATATILLPIMASASIALDFHPFALMISCVFAANAAFMLPVATPPNAIIFSTGKITILDMIKVGFAMNIFTAVIIIIATLYWLPVVWNIDLIIIP